MEDMNCMNIPVHVSKLTSLCLPSIKSWPTWSLIANTPIARTDILHAVHGTLLEQNIRYVVPQCAMKKYRKQIPISSKKWDILNGIANNKVILIRGIVSVGKSSQVAQFILEDAAALNKSVHVILLKPQIFGTRDLAEKIAMDRGEIVGSTVGYISTYERIYTAITSLFVSTYEVFLKTFVGRTDFLNTVTHLIIDDVDKKSVFHNLIMYIIRKHKSRFPKLKVILLSDSDNNDQIISYFRPVTINVNAKQATVMMSYTQNKLTSFPIETMNNKLDLSEFLVNEFNKLCFATVVVYTADYKNMIDLQTRLKQGPRSQFMDIILLHESIPIETRRRVFHDTPSDIQRVVITDEAFIPIRDVKCIIDFGLKRHMLYDFGYDFFRTFYSWKSRKEAIHITERSTHSHVSVYRLYNVDEFEEFYDRNTNQNQSIQKICAYAELLADDENSIVSILQNLYDPVSLVYIYFGIKSLRISNAMDNFGRVTQLGVYVMQLSVPPNLGKMLIHACILQCLDPVITLVSFIINGYLSYLENLKYEHFHYFYDGILSSHVMILKLFEEYQECVCYNRNFGIRYGYSSEDMEIILMTRMKLTRELKEIGIIQNKKQRNLAHANMNATNWPLVQACLVIGHYPKLLHYVKEGCIVLDYCCKKSLSLEGQLKNIISKSSIERCSIVYNILNANLTTCNPTGYTVVPELTAFLFCPKVNGMSNYWMYTSVSKKLYELKKSYEKLVEIRLSYPSIYMAHTEQNILTSIKKLLMLEFNMAALKSPSFDFSCRMRFCHELKHI